MEERITVDLMGLNLNEQEKVDLQEHLHKQLIEFLKVSGAKAPDAVVALGPGWIGIQAD